jgi:hypothetical protein
MSYPQVKWPKGNGFGQKFGAQTGHLALVTSVASRGNLGMGVTGDIANTGKELTEGREPGEGILDAGRNVIEGMKTTTGTGMPDDGSTFGAAAAQLGKTHGTAADRAPTPPATTSSSAAPPR